MPTYKIAITEKRRGQLVVTAPMDRAALDDLKNHGAAIAPAWAVHMQYHMAPAVHPWWTTIYRALGSQWNGLSSNNVDGPRRSPRYWVLIQDPDHTPLFCGRIGPDATGALALLF